MKNFLFILFLILCSNNLFATHLRGGELIYEYISGNTYRFTIVTCNDPDGIAPADFLSVDFDDGTSLLNAPLINGPFGTGSFVEAIYQIDHTFTGDGYYTIRTSVENRNEDILNITASGDQSACFETLLVINSFARPYNNSVYFENGVCPEIACVGQEYCFNPLAVDPDGDSLYYSLVIPKGYLSPGGSIGDCADLSYSSPNVVGGGNLSINSTTGSICWDSPNVAGEYVFVVRVDEYFKGFHVGYVIRDIQLTVDGSCSNVAPIINAIPDQSVIAGESVSIDISSSHTDGNNVQIIASGLPFIETNSANFNSVSGNPGTGSFTWDTSCDNIKSGSYNHLVTIEATDLESTPAISSYLTFHINITPSADCEQLNVSSFRKVNNLIIAPNPNAGSFIVKLNTNNFTELRLIDVTGKIIKDLKSQSPQQEIEVTGLKNGIYFLKADNQTHRVIVSN